MLKRNVSDRMNDEFNRYCINANMPFAVDLIGSRGCYLRTADGQQILDFAGYYGSKLLGHNHPGLETSEFQKRLLVAAINKTPNPDFLTTECLDFYRLVFSLAPRSMAASNGLEVYAVNSGAEVVENMLKYLISRFNSSRRSNTGKRRLISFERSFHGRTVFSLSITNVNKTVMTRDFHPLFTDNIRVPFPAAIHHGLDAGEVEQFNRDQTERSLAAIDEVIRRYPGETAAVILEPIQSAGGHNIASAEFYPALSELLHDRGVFLGVDEVQTGMGATGRLFFVDHIEMPHPPQALVVAKKMAVGVLYMLDHLEDQGVLDSTWGGGLVDMVRFLGEYEVVRRESLVNHAAEMGSRLNAGLRVMEERYPDVLFNARGLGLMQGFTVLPSDTSEARDLLLKIALHEKLLLMLGAGTGAVRLRPMLTTDATDVDRFLNILEEVILEFRRRRPRTLTSRIPERTAKSAAALLGT